MSQALTRTSLRTRGRSHFSQPILRPSILLVLPFFFAGLAIILFLSPHRRSPAAAVDAVGSRTRTVLLREEAVTIREADVANREAELQAIPNQDFVCPPCVAPTVIEIFSLPAPTVIEKIVVVKALSSARATELLNREQRVAHRERNVGQKEERLSRREHEASQLEDWILGQLIVGGL
ncbi:hypothetical protein B0H14DRAFT_3861020 [Mycena olivaceomarginata]|nr:hypothetical protein B0H14DRAFT_3861020 [Mycena olivaceomarginata]